jgi:hypothetical protein
MKQLYYAFGGEGAGQVRAATHGLTGEQQVAAVAAAGRYAAPAGGTPSVRLALTNTPAGRVLAHSAGTGGAYFAHVLLDIPPTLDAQHVVQTWGSPLWRLRDDGGGVELPEVPYLPVADALTDESLRAFLASPARRDLLEFVLSAWLSRSESGRVYVAAPAETVAMLAFALTCALPPALLEDFTFTTADPDPAGAGEALVGGQPADDLADECYAPPNFAVNDATGRRTELAEVVPFAAFAVRELAAGATTALDEFKATWQRLGVKRADLLDLVYRMARGTGVLSKEEAQAALQDPALAAWLSARPDALNQFLEWALEDRGFAHAAFTRAVVALRQRPELLEKLAGKVRQVGLAAVADGDTERAGNALEAVLPLVARAKAGTVWADVLARVPDPAKITWPMRWYLLPRLVRYRPAVEGVDPALARWVAIPPEQLEPLLALGVPRAYHLAGSRAALGGAESVPAEAAAALAAHPEVLFDLLPRLGGGTMPQDRDVFAAVLQAAPQADWADALVARADALPAETLDRGLTAAIDAGRAAPAPLVRRHGPALLTRLAGKSSLNELARKLFAAPPPDVLSDAALLDFLRGLNGQPGVTADVAAAAGGVLALHDFLARPALDASTLDGVSAGLAVRPRLGPPGLWGRVAAAVQSVLANAADVQTDLEAALAKLGPHAEGGPPAMYRDLVRLQQPHRAFWKNPDAVHAFLAVALGAAKTPDLAAKLEQLESDASALAFQAGRRGGRKVLDAVDARTADWPRTARTQWGFLREAVRPRGGRDLARDLAIFAAGALAALVGRWLLDLAGVL